MMPISFQLNDYFQFENFNIPFEVVQYILYTACGLIEFLVKFGHFHLLKTSMGTVLTEAFSYPATLLPD